MALLTSCCFWLFSVVVPLLSRNARIPNSNLGAGALAAKALVYGTALCIAGFTVTSVAVAIALGVKDVSEENLRAATSNLPGTTPFFLTVLRLCKANGGDAAASTT